MLAWRVVLLHPVQSIHTTNHQILPVVTKDGLAADGDDFWEAINDLSLGMIHC